VTLDDGFGKDVEEGIRERSQPWNPPMTDTLPASERKIGSGLNEA
jgi:hypothetical protein